MRAGIAAGNLAYPHPSLGVDDGHPPETGAGVVSALRRNYVRICFMTIQLS